MIDASVLATALANDGTAGDLSRSRLSGESLTAPELIDLEVVSTLRGLVRGRKVTTSRAEIALRDLRLMPFERASHRGLAARCWELRSNLTPHDAAYVALAEILGMVLVTADARLARASGPRCHVEVLTA